MEPAAAGEGVGACVDRLLGQLLSEGINAALKAFADEHNLQTKSRSGYVSLIAKEEG